MVRLALVGFGKWGRNYLRAAHDSGEAEVVAVCNRTTKIDTGNTTVETWTNGLLHAVRKVDAVVYAGHPDGAKDVALTVLDMGLPLMIEKPAGLSVSDAEYLVGLEDIYSGLVLVNHQHLFAAAFEKLYLDAPDTLMTGSSCFGGDGPVRSYSALWDYGPHAVSAALALLGRGAVVSPPEEAKAKAEGFGGFRLRSSRGLIDCLASNTSGSGSYARVYLRKGMHPSYDGYTLAEPCLTRSVRAFARAVKDQGTTDWRFGADWAVDVARILEAVQER